MALAFSLYLPLFYLGLFLAAFSASLYSHHRATGLFLTIVYLFAWIDPIWYDAWNLMVAEGILLFFMLSTASDRMTTAQSYYVTMMLVANGTFHMGSWPEFWRLSAINILFTLMCINILVLSYNYHEISKNKARRDGLFMAKVSRSS